MSTNRERKTGPCFPLAVVRCRTHGIYFTLYPHGHVPYGREPVVGNISPSGQPIIDESSRESDQPSSTQDTIFDAAFEASQGKAWPKEGKRGSLLPRFPTMLQKLDRAARLLGVHESLNRTQMELICDVMGLPGQVAYDYRNILKEQPGFKETGKAICHLLQMVPQSIYLYERFTEVGAICQLWPTPQFWNSSMKRLQKSLFHRVGTRAPPSKIPS